MSNLIIIPKKNGYLVRNQINNREMAVFKTKQDAQLFIKNYKVGKVNIHNHNHRHGHDHNNHIYGVQSNGNAMPMHSNQYSTTTSYGNMVYQPQMQGQIYPNMIYQPQMQGQIYPNMIYQPQMQGQIYPNMVYPQQFPIQPPYNPNMMNGYSMQNNMPSSMNLQCECGYIYNNEYEDEMPDEDEDFLDFETDDNPELIKPPEISEMNKTIDEQKTEQVEKLKVSEQIEKPKVSEPVEPIQKEEKTTELGKEQIIVSEVINQQEPFVNVEPIVVKEPTIMMSDLTNFAIETDDKISNMDDNHVVHEQNDTANLSKKELKQLKKQQKKELKLIKKQEKRNKDIYDEMEDYDF